MTATQEMSWRAAARCGQVRTRDLRKRDPFYPAAVKTGSRSHAAAGVDIWAQARKVCAECPVIEQCLAEALEEEGRGPRYGFRGGRTPAERDALCPPAPRGIWRGGSASRAGGRRKAEPDQPQLELALALPQGRDVA